MVFKLSFDGQTTDDTTLASKLAFFFKNFCKQHPLHNVVVSMKQQHNTAGALHMV